MTKSRIFLWGMVAFIAGVGVRSFFVVPQVLLWIAVIGSIVAVGIGLARKQKKSAIAGFFLLAAIAGIARFDAAEQNHPDLLQLYGKQVVAQGIVAEEPVMSEKSERLKMKITAVNNHAALPHFFVLAGARKYPAYALGDELKLEGKIEKPENYGDFDYVSYLARENVFSVMAFPKIEKVAEGKGNPILLALSRVKHNFEENINAALPEPHAAFMQGLILGERASLPPELTDDFKRAGVSHIVALSGYNITIVGRSIIGALIYFSVPFAISFWIAAGAITLFVLMTGAAASVVRAGIMGILVLVARKEGRPYSMTNALVFAAAVMIFQNPFVLRFDAGFQLSFLATAGLVYLSPYVEQWINRFWKSKKDGMAMVKTLRTILVETLSAQIMVLPLLISLFGLVSLVSPLTNILILAVVPQAMGLGFVAGAAGFLWQPLAVVIGWAAWVLLEYQLRVIHFLAHIPFASVEVGSWVILPLLGIYAILFFRLLKKAKNALI